MGHTARRLLGIMNGTPLHEGDFVKWGSPCGDMGRVTGVIYPIPPCVYPVMLVVETRDYPDRHVEIHDSTRIIFSPADQPAQFPHPDAQ